MAPRLHSETFVRSTDTAPPCAARRWRDASKTATVLALAVGVSGCALWSTPEPAPALPPAEKPAVVRGPWPVEPGRIEELIRHSDRRLVSREELARGVTGAHRVVWEFPNVDDPVAFKWRRAPAPDLDAWNDSPRRELAAYELQKWFLEPAEFVVPPTAVYCGSRETTGGPPSEGFACELGVASLWIERADIPDVLWEPERFGRDATYAHRIADFDVFTFLIQQRDGGVGGFYQGRGNFLADDDERPTRFYAVDNGISFGEWFFNFFAPNWSGLRVAALPQRTVERLRRVTPTDLDRLGVLVELERRSDGWLVPVEASENFDPAQGVRREGRRIQLGLTRPEIDDVATRLRAVLDATRQGKLRTL